MTSTTTPPETTTYDLVAITDGSISKIHLGAVQKANRSWCGVALLVKDDPRFGGRYKDIVFTTSAKLDTVDCGACKRSAAWKARSGRKYVVPAPSTQGRPRKAAVKGATVPAPKGVSANEAQEMANRAAEAQSGQAKAPSTGKGKKTAKGTESVDNAARRAAEAVPADAPPGSARLAAEQVTGGAVVETDPDTGLPRIKPEIQAKADQIVADQLAKNAETDAAAARIESGETTVEAEVINILDGGK